LIEEVTERAPRRVITLLAKKVQQGFVKSSIRNLEKRFILRRGVN